MKIIERDLDSIRPYEKNPRQNDAGVDELAKSIEMFGFNQPIVIDSEGVIVVGHTRYKAALKLGLKKAPVYVATHLTPEKAKAYRIKDNQVATLSKWDEELLMAEIADLEALGFESALLGFPPEELARYNQRGPAAAGNIDPDDIPAPPDKATTQKGDVWILGDHRLCCGDSASPEDLDRLVDGVTIDLLNTDPPYNVKVEPRSNNAIAAGLGSTGLMSNQKFDLARNPNSANATDKKLRAKDRPLANDFISASAFDERLLAWFANASRVMAAGRCCYIWGGYANVINYPPAIAAAKFHIAQAIIWVKEHPVLTRKDFMGNHEWCFYGWKNGAPHRWFGKANTPDVWRLSRGQRTADGGSAYDLGRGLRIETEQGATLDVATASPNRKLRRVSIAAGGSIEFHTEAAPTDVWTVKKVTPQLMIHLTEKPVELAARAIQYSSLPGEAVLDLFGGSGSTLIACEQAGRRAFLMEIDPLYCDVIVDRWQKFTGKKARRVTAAGKPKTERRTPSKSQTPAAANP